MSKQLFHATAKFQVPDGLLNAGRAKAAREGMTFSELMRQALRREVRDDMDAAPAGLAGGRA